MIEKIINILYPPVCGVCGKINNNSLCNKCKIQLNSQSVFGIDNYNNEDIYFKELLYVFTYGGIIRKMVLNYKFNDDSYLYKTFTNFILKNEKFIQKIKSYDIIIPVPLSNNRKKERGYNQSELIAKAISKKLNITIDRSSLIKIKNNNMQSSLNKEERIFNIKGAYTINNNNRINNKNILLIDDIFTTGNTVNECSKTLLQANPKKIGVLTIAKD